jgi:hypothetical protein
MEKLLKENKKVYLCKKIKTHENTKEEISKYSRNIENEYTENEKNTTSSRKRHKWRTST